jgi:flagellar assembly protein FliH
LQEQSLQTDNSQSVTQQKSLEEDDINLFDLDNIDFSQRQERRRGDRRRGFRRVDDRNLVSRVHEEAEAIRESARKEGYQAGLEQAQEDVMQLRQAIENFVGVKQEVFEYIAPNILDISVDIAKKIIKKEIEQGPQVLINTVVDVLKTSLSKEETKVTLRVNPSEVNEIKQAIPDIIDLAGIDTKIVVLADDEVSEGGCQITTTNGIVDATIESRMRVVMQALREL